MNHLRPSGDPRVAILARVEAPSDSLMIRQSVTDGAAEAPEELELRIEQDWAEAVRRTGRSDSSNLVALRDLRVSGEGVDAVFGKTSYREFMGSTRPDDLRRYGYRALSQALGVCCTLVTEDGFVLVERRGDGGIHPGLLHVVGGMVDWDEDVVDQRVELSRAAAREVEEELGVEVAAQDLVPLGFSYDLVHPHPELCFTGRLPLKLEEAEKRAQATEEFQVIEPIPADPCALESVLRERAGEFVPTGLGALLLFGAWSGSPWCRSQVAAHLVDRLPGT